MSEHLFNGVSHDDGRGHDPLLARHAHEVEHGALTADIRDGIVRVVRAELASQAPELLRNADFRKLRCGGRRSVDVLGELLNRLPESLSIAEVCLVLDRFDVALRGHASSPLVDAPGPESRVASESIVGDVPGAVETSSTPAPGAPSGVKS